MRRIRAGVVAVVAVLAVALLVDVAVNGGRVVWGWAEIHSGTARGGPDPYYNFWSGIGSDLGEVTLVTAVVAMLWGAYRKAKCCDPQCWRLGKHPTEGATFHFCHHHHPELRHAAGRKLSVDEMYWHHHEALRVKHGVDPPSQHAENRPEGANIR